MNTSTIADREHHFYCAIAKHVFAHRKHGIVFTSCPIRIDEAKHYGLQPLLLYGVTVAGTTLKRLVLSPLLKPLSFSSVLEEAWESAPGLKGVPTTVKVSRHIAAACPALADSLAALGVSLVVADSKDKQFPPSLRSAQQEALELGCRTSTTPPIDSVEDFNRASLRQLTNEIQFRSWQIGSRERTARTDAWLKLPSNPLTSPMPDSGLWVAGPWLSSWEVSFPPASLYRLRETAGENTWLVEEGTYEEDEDEGFSRVDDVPGKAKLLIACWPNKPSEIASALGITLRELQWFLSGRTHLADPIRDGLICLLGLEYNEEYLEHEPIYSRVLIASTLNATIAAYGEISQGGDLSLSFEAVPKQSPADPSWRYLVMEAWGMLATIFMIPRGSVVAENLDHDHFINFQGVREIRDSVYRDIVQTCAKACTSPLENRKAAIEFVRRHRDYLEAFECEY